jgi:hypothetical protein
LLLEKTEGELPPRREALRASSQSDAQPSAAVPYILKVSPKNNGSEQIGIDCRGASAWCHHFEAQALGAG